MRVLSLPALLIAALAATSGCGGDDDGEATDDDIIRLDDASEEVVLTMRDLVQRGNVVVDDEVAALLTAPASGTELPADEAPTFTWSTRGSTARHGLTTGEFVWLNITGPGMDAPIDVVAIESTSWPVDEEHWELLRGSTGPCEVKVYSAYVERGLVENDEVFAPTESPTFSVIE
jgi:hypothetical protein